MQLRCGKCGQMMGDPLMILGDLRYYSCATCVRLYRLQDGHELEGDEMTDGKTGRTAGGATLRVRVHDDGDIQVRVQPISNGYIVRGGFKPTYFATLAEAVSEIGISIEFALSEPKP